MTAYYNEFCPFMAQWLRNLIDRGLIPAGDVDTRSIKEVQPDDIRHYTQVHFFAGLGGWPLALRLAGWADDRRIWSGSCPCQPFSSAGKQQGHADERHLWPEMFRLARECGPDTVIGEQVASAIGHGWLDGVFDDLEGAGYTCGAAVLGAFSVGAPHKRSRLFWLAESMADAQRGAAERQRHDVDGAARGVQGAAREQRLRSDAGDGGNAQSVADAEPVRAGTGNAGIEGRQGGGRVRPAIGGHAVALEHPAGDGRDARRAEPDGRGAASGCGTNAWSDFTVVHCLDGKARRAGRGVFPLVDGLPRELGRGQPELFRLARRARANRAGRLKGMGNAIIPQVAAEFVAAWMEARP